MLPLPDSAFCTALEEREQTDLNRNLKDFNVSKYMQDVSGNFSQIQQMKQPHHMRFTWRPRVA